MEASVDARTTSMEAASAEVAIASLEGSTADFHVNFHGKLVQNPVVVRYLMEASMEVPMQVSIEEEEAFRNFLFREAPISREIFRYFHGSFLCLRRIFHGIFHDFHGSFHASMEAYIYSHKKYVVRNW